MVQLKEGGGGRSTQLMCISLSDTQQMCYSAICQCSLQVCYVQVFNLTLIFCQVGQKKKHHDASIGLYQVSSNPIVSQDRCLHCIFPIMTLEHLRNLLSASALSVIFILCIRCNQKRSRTLNQRGLKTRPEKCSDLPDICAASWEKKKKETKKNSGESGSAIKHPNVDLYWGSKSPLLRFLLMQLWLSQLRCSFQKEELQRHHEAAFMCKLCEKCLKLIKTKSGAHTNFPLAF